ncbi:zinc transporter 2-like [Pomacea canaliculata]|uniref:zinc transporter 2-like n=1 Tax=Pomacea canaliculata TaxID=400727 RepID=UPI000D72937B|nr:zinc transporter 2-like [Pomacea canaliculata]
MARRSTTSRIEFTHELDETTEVWQDCGTEESRGKQVQGLKERSHCHKWPDESRLDKKARKRLLIASFLCLIFMVGELVGGYFAHSLAVMSDAAHLLTDFASFMIGLMALHLSSRPSTARFNFGWYRAEVLGALLSIIMLWTIAAVLVYSGVQRIQNENYKIDATIMLITSVTGVVYNIIMAISLHQHDHGHGHSHSHSSSQRERSMSTTSLLSPDNGYAIGDHYGSMTRTENNHTQVPSSQSPKKTSNINVRAAFIHVLGDLCQSVGVLVAAIIIYFKPEWKIADPICTFLFSIFVLVTTLNILRDITLILMEGTPRSIRFEEVRHALLNLEGVQDLHDLRVWSLTLNRAAMSVHLVIRDGVSPLQIVKTATFLIQDKFNISQTTIQAEEYAQEMERCVQCQELRS